MRPYGRIGAEHDPLGGDPSQQRHDLEGVHPGAVVHHRRIVAQPVGDDRLVGDPQVREDQPNVGVSGGDLDQLGAELRRQTGAGMNQHRHLALLRHRENRLHTRVSGQPEGLCPRVQLDPPRTRIQGALGFGNRVFGGIKATEGDEPALAGGGPLEHSVVGHPVARMTIGIVKRKRHRAIRAANVQQVDQLGRGQRHTVLVETEVGMHVDDFHTRRAKLIQLPGEVLQHPSRRAGHQAGSRASIASETRSRTSCDPIRSSTSSKKPRTISRSASAWVSPRAIR